MAARQYRCACHLLSRWRIDLNYEDGSAAMLKAPTFVAGLDDVAVVGQAVEQRRRHLWIAEHGSPFREGEVSGDDDRGAFVEPTDQMEQQLAARQRERGIAELVEDEKVDTCQRVGGASSVAEFALHLELVGEVNSVEEARLAPLADDVAGCHRRGASARNAWG